MLEPRDPLDEALDDALRTYGRAPKSDGLEGRIVAQLDKRARGARSAKWLTASIGAAAVLVACLFAGAVGKEVLDVPTLSLWRGHSCLPCRDSSRHHLAQLSKARAPNIAGEHRPRRTRTVKPKLSRFPAPSRMTSEERALIRLVASAAKNPSLRLDPIGGSIKPIRITAIDIKPLGWGR